MRFLVPVGDIALYKAEPNFASFTLDLRTVGFDFGELGRVLYVFEDGR